MKQDREPETLIWRGFPMSPIPATASGLPFSENHKSFRCPPGLSFPGKVICRSRFLDHEELITYPAFAQRHTQLLRDQSIATISFQHSLMPATCRSPARSG